MSHLDAVKNIYDDWSNGHFATGTELYDESMVLILPAEIPDSGVYTGSEAVRDYMRGFLEAWTELTMHGSGFRENGDTVVARVTQRGTGRRSGVETELEYHHLWSFRGGRVIRLELIVDEKQALEAAGISPGDQGEVRHPD